MTILRSLLLTALMALVVAAKTNLADDVVPEGQFYDQQEVAAGEEPVSEESVPDFIRSSKAAATATEGFLQDTEDPAGYAQAGHCYTMRIGFKPWNGMEMASHFQTAYAQSLITGYKKGGDVAQSTAYLTSKCQERCDASNDCTGFYYELSQYWVDRANDGGDGTGSALGDCQLFYQHSDTCVTDCLASPYFAKALEARGSDYETGMVTWLHTTWADQCQAYCGKPPAGRSDLQGKSHWSIKQNRNGYPTCTDPVGDCAPEIARYEADSSMCGTWTWGGMGFSYKKSMTAETPTEPPTDAPTDSPTDAPTVTDAPTDSPTDAPTVTDAPTDASTCNRQDQGGFMDTAGWTVDSNPVTTCGWMAHICTAMANCECYEQGGDTKCQWTYLQAAHGLPAANCGICRGFKIPDTYGRSSRYHTDSWAHYNSDAATQVWTGNWICPAGTGSCGWDAPTQPGTPVFHDIQGETYTSNKQTCTATGKQLCTYDQICPNGQGSPAMGGYTSGHNEGWAPIWVADGQPNDMVYIRATATHSNECRRHNKDWQAKSNAWSDFSNVFCCEPPK